MRNMSKVASDWWDYTTLDSQLLQDAAALSADALLGLSRPGFTIRSYETPEAFYLAEALEYIRAWQEASDSEPAGICGPIWGADRAVAAGCPDCERSGDRCSERTFLGHG